MDCSPVRLMAGAEVASEGMERIEEMSDADVVDVHESASVFRDVEETTADLRGLLDCLCGLRWMTAGMKNGARSRFEPDRLTVRTKAAESLWDSHVAVPPIRSRSARGSIIGVRRTQ